jgi:hypothetical protein
MAPSRTTSFPCLARTGVYTPVLAKRSKHFSLDDSLAIGVMQRNFGPLKHQVEGFQAVQFRSCWMVRLPSKDHRKIKNYVLVDPFRTANPNQRPPLISSTTPTAPRKNTALGL